MTADYDFTSSNSKIVLSKLAAPSLSIEHILRPRLHKLLKRNLHDKIILISSPPGSGKTSLMREWQLTLDGDRDDDFSTAWLTLDRKDENPVRMWSHFFEAMSRAFKSAFFDADEQDGSIDTRAVEFSNHLFRLESQERQVVFMDEFDSIPESAQDDLLEFIFEYLPDTSTVVIASSTHPALLADYRYANQTSRIATRDLFFTREETDIFIRSCIDDEVPVDIVDRIHDLSMGWPMGIRLLFYRIEHRDLSAGDDLFANFNKDVRVDGFFSSYFQRPELAPVLDFMVDTSLCDIICADLCNAITGCDDAQQKIEILEEHDLLFPVPGRRPGWYHFHPMFGRWLQTRLVDSGETRVLQTANRAGEWFKDREFEGESAKLVLIGSDADFIENLVDASCLDYVQSEEDFLTWTCSLDPDRIARQTIPCLYIMWAYYLADDARNLRIWLTHFKEAIANDKRFDRECNKKGTISQMTQLVEIKCSQYEGRYDETVKSLEMFIDTHADLPSSMSCLAYHALGEAYERVGKFDSAYTYYLKSEALADAVQSEFYKMFGYYSLAWIQMMSGDLRQSMKTCSEALGKCPVRYSLHGAIQGLLAYTQIETFEIDAAETNINEALDGLSPVRNADMWLEAQIIRSRLLLSQGKEDEAYRCIVAAIAPYDEGGLSRGELLFAYIERARIDIVRGDLDDAKECIAKLVAASGYADAFYALKIEFVRNVIIGLENASEETLHRLRDVGQEARQLGFNYLYLDVLINEVLLCNRMGMRTQCFPILYEALRIASAENAINPFLQERTEMVTLLHEVANLRRVGHVERSFARLLLSVVYDTGPAADKATPEGVIGGIHLTSREREVLRLLNMGLSRQEMAQEMDVSLNTVKTHVSNLYNKLGVTNREDAFSISRFLGD